MVKNDVAFNRLNFCISHEPHARRFLEGDTYISLLIYICMQMLLRMLMVVYRSISYQSTPFGFVLKL